MFIFIVLALGIAAYFLLFRNTSNQVQTSPTPSVSESAVPTVKDISDYFPQVATKTADLKADQTAQDDFLALLNEIQPPIQQALRIPVTGPFSISLSEFLSGVGVVVPSDFKSVEAADWAVMSYGQNEQFDAQGQTLTNSTVQPRLIMMTELKDVSLANQMMQAWEANGLASSLLDLAGFDKNKASSTGFLGGTYKQIPIRYQNYPYADQSLDYAIILASNGHNYLVISTSRESIFFAIDQLTQ